MNRALAPLVSYAARGEHWYRTQTLPAGETEFEVKLREQIAVVARPKLSLHWSKLPLRNENHLQYATSTQRPTAACPRITAATARSIGFRT